MKKMIISAFALALVSTASYAQTVKTTNPPAPQATQQDNKVKVEPAALPQPIQTTLAGDSYKGWTVSSAWKSGDIYIIELKNGANTKTVDLDKDGKQVG